MAKKKGSKVKEAIKKGIEVLSSGKKSIDERNETITVRVHVDTSCPRELALATKDALVPQRSGGIVNVCDLTIPTGSTYPDVAIVLIGQRDAASLVSTYAYAGIPVLMIGECALDMPDLSLSEEAAAYVSGLAVSDAAELPEALGEWLVKQVDNRIALSANFVCCRHDTVERLVTRCSLENAAVGAVSLIPRSDFPIMTANQASMALDISAAYGKDADVSRLFELAAVVALGYCYRSLARTSASIMPNIEHVLKAGVGYAGTYVTGNALRLRFELEDRLENKNKGASVTPSIARLGAPHAHATSVPFASTSADSQEEPVSIPVEVPMATEAASSDDDLSDDNYVVIDEAHA